VAGSLPAVQPFRLALIPDDRIPDRLLSLEIGRGVELAPGHSLAEVVPLSGLNAASVTSIRDSPRR
jgi:hypothetical protein